jgi:membrane protease YdiL (CAAX protease family)
MIHEKARIRSVIELLAIAALIALDQWWLGPQELRMLYVINLLILILLGVSVYLRTQRIPRPFRPPRPSWSRALSVVLLATLAEVALLLTAAWVTGTLEQDFTLSALGKSRNELPVWFLEKIAFVFVQQVALQVLVFPLCFHITRSRWPAALLGSTLFGLMHGPNPFLATVSFLTGPVWFWLYLYSDRLLPLVVSHLLLVILVRFALPSHIHLNMITGAKALPLLRSSQWLYTHEFFPILSRYGSREYYEQQGETDERFISGLYRDILGRRERESEEENALWRKLLISKTRTEVVILFLTSREYLQKNNLTPP